MTDVVALVEGAKAKGTFSVLDTIKERSYPEDIKTVYMDVASAYKIKALEALDADEVDTEAHGERVAQINELKALIAESAMTFRLRGIGSGTKKAIKTEASLKFPVEYDALGQYVSGGPDFGEGAEWNNAKVLAEHIVSVTDLEGNVDEHHWSPEEVLELKATLPEESFQEIENLMFALSFAATYFDASVTPDFS